MIPRRRALFAVLVAAAAVYLFLSPALPKANVVHIVLGPAAPRVTELRVRYAPAPATLNAAPRVEDWTREASFRFSGGSAPRIVTHEPRVPPGDYVVEIEIVKASPPSTTLQRTVKLEGGTTSIDAASTLATDPGAGASEHP